LQNHHAEQKSLTGSRTSRSRRAYRIAVARSFFGQKNVIGIRKRRSNSQVVACFLLVFSCIGLIVGGDGFHGKQRIYLGHFSVQVIPILPIYIVIF
jgi:hypothetical protein